MSNTNLTEKDYNVLYTGVLEHAKLLSSNIAVDGIYCSSSIHNYHNVYSKPVINITVITHRVNGKLSELVDDMNSTYNEKAVVRAEIIDHKSLLDTMNIKRFEIIDATILYDRYGEYRRMQTEFKNSNMFEIENPRVIRLNHKINVK